MTSLAESEASQRARHFHALEGRLFELVGGWVPSVPEPEAKILLRSHSFQHAWHAELWSRLLPLGVDEDPHGGRLRPGVVGVLEAASALEGTVERFSGLYAVLLPELIRTYEGVRARSADASDGPVQRVLTLVVTDLSEACRAGKGLVEGVAPGPDDGTRARAVRAALAAGSGLDAREIR